MAKASHVIGTTALAGSIIIGPGTVASALNAGSLYGLRLLWVVLVSAVAAASMGYIVAKVTAVTGQTTFTLIDKHVKAGAGALVAYAEIILHVAVVIASAYTLADALSALTGWPQAAGLGVILPPSLLLWAWTGNASRLRRVLGVFVLAMVAMFAAILCRTGLDMRAAAAGLTPWVPSGAVGLLVVMGLVGGTGGDAILVMLPYQVKAARLGPADARRLCWDAIVFLGVAFGLVSLCVLAVGHALSTGEPLRRAADAAHMLSAGWGRGVGTVFLLGFIAAAWTTTAGPSLCPGLLLADARSWRSADGHLLVDGDMHRDRRVKVATSLTILGWLAFLPLAQVVPPFGVLMFGLGVINCFVPFLLAVTLWVSRSRSAMGEHRLGAPALALGVMGLLFSCVGAAATAIFVARMLFPSGAA